MNKKQRKKVLNLTLIISIVAIILIAAIILIPINKVDKDDMSYLNGFYNVEFLEGYNMAYRSDDGCDYVYKGLVLKDGDKLIKGRVLSSINCEWCGKNETFPVPTPFNKATLDIEGTKENFRADLLFKGTGAEFKDLVVIQ